MNTQESFKTIARRKIAGWYSRTEWEDKAVERMTAVRDEIIGLLRSTGREGVEDVIEYLDSRGFYYRASSPTGHHNFPGGLAEHSLGTYKRAQAKAGDLPADSVIITALLHDICKADRFWFKGRTILKHTERTAIDRAHSSRSIAILKDCGLRLTESERLAIRWHMKDEFYRPRDPRKAADHAKAANDPLWRVVFYADKADAGSSRHNHSNRQDIH